MNHIDVTIDKKRIALVLVACITVLLVFHIVHVLVHFAVPPEAMRFDTIHLLLGRFYMNGERTVPAFFSAVLLLSCSLLLLVIGHQWKSRRGGFRLWYLLAFIFLFLAFDEAASLHELMNGPFRNRLNTGGALYWAWVIPYGILLTGFVLAYTRFLFRLPKNIRYLVIASGAVYVFGAMGLEILGSTITYDVIVENAYDTSNIPLRAYHPMYAVVSTLEELFEMAGASLFIFTLVSYISQEFEAVSVRLGSRSETGIPSK